MYTTGQSEHKSAASERSRPASAAQAGSPAGCCVKMRTAQSWPATLNAVRSNRLQRAGRQEPASTIEPPGARRFDSLVGVAPVFATIEIQVATVKNIDVRDHHIVNHFHSQTSSARSVGRGTARGATPTKESKLRAPASVDQESEWLRACPPGVLPTRTELGRQESEGSALRALSSSSFPSPP